METIENIRLKFKDKLNNEEFVTDKTGQKVIEIIGGSFKASDSAIFGKVNDSYIKKELAWYLTEERNIRRMENPPKIWLDVCGLDGEVNSNYGWCLFSSENGSQYENIKKELITNPLSRRAEAIYNRPEMHAEYNINGMSDFMCTNAVSYLIRDSRLSCVVQMRSNDAIYGYKNDRAWHDFTLDLLLQDLKDECDLFKLLNKGDIMWNAASLHVYERHFSLIKGE